MKHDVVVVGGGAIGLATAWFLSQRGASVLVLDHSVLDRGTSTGNGGWIVSSHIVPLAAPKVVAQGLAMLLDPRSAFYIRPRPSPELICWLWWFRGHCTEAHLDRAAPLFTVLNALSHGLYRRFAAMDDFDFGYEERGLLDVFRDEATFVKGQRSAADLQTRFGLATEVLDRAATLALEPGLVDDVVGGLLHAQDAHIDPARFVGSLRRAVEAAGVEVRSGVEVTGFQTEGRRVTALVTSAGEVPAGEVVLAAGTWSGRLAGTLGLRIPMEAGKGYSITVPRQEGMPSRPLRLAEAKVAFTPMGDQVRFAGTLELAGIDPTVSGPRVEGILAGIRSYLRHDGPWEQTPPWVGLRPCTPDGLPCIGRPAAWDNLVLATGHATVGMTLAPATGHLVAQIVGDETPDIEHPLLSPDRFH